MKYAQFFLKLMTIIIAISTTSLTQLTAASASAAYVPAQRRSSMPIPCEHIKFDDERFKETNDIDFSFPSPQGISPYFMVTQGENATGHYLVITLNPSDVNKYSNTHKIKFGIRVKRCQDASLSIELVPSLAEEIRKDAHWAPQLTISSLECDTKLGKARYLLERKLLTKEETVVTSDVPTVTFNLALDPSTPTPRAFYRTPSTGNGRINIIFPLS